MLNYVHIYYGYHYAQNYAAKAYPMVPFTGKFTLHYILRTFFTMAVDDVLPVSDFLSDEFASLTVPVPVPPLEMDSACNTLPPPSSVDVLSDNELKLILKGQRNSNTERKTKFDY